MFDAIKDLLFYKQAPTAENLENFFPSRTLRYASFYSPDVAQYVNETLNQYGYVLESREDQYKLFSNVLPSLKEKFIKVPNVEREEKEDVPVPEFYSKREVEMLLKQLDT